MYICKLLKPLNERNPIESSKNEKFVTKTYMFDITKYEKKIDLLDKHIIVPPGLKTPPIREDKKYRFLKVQ